MSHLHSTRHTNFDQVLLQVLLARLASLEAILSGWGAKSFSGKGALDRDEALQQARIVLWRRFCQDPATWAAHPVRVWVSYGCKVFEHTLLHERIVERHTDYVEDLVPDDSDRTGEEALSGRVCAGGRRSPYPREIELADDRIDLERAIQRGFAVLPERYHADMRCLMADIMTGYTQREIQARHGWSFNHTRVLFRHLRTTFYTALTGRERPQGEPTGTTTPASEADLARLAELRAQGLSFVKIAARMGYSEAWVAHNLKRQSAHRTTLAERARARRSRGLAAQALRAQGMAYREIAQALGTSYNPARRLVAQC